MSKKDLHKKFQKLGRERNRITYKLLALLPQIYKEKVYESVGFTTIYEYAGKLAGLPHSVVEKALKLEKKLAGKPHLQKMIETQGIHKVAMVAGIATEENEEDLADKVENMSKPALQEYSKELRAEGQIVNRPKIKIELDRETEFLFLKLKNKLGKKLSNKEMLKRIVKEKVEEEFGKKKIPGEKRDAGRKVCSSDSEGRSVTRYIPVRKKREALSKTDDKCSHPNCCKPAEVLHHRDRFSVSGSHESIIPLCKTHHEFVHNGLIKNEKEDVKNWKVEMVGQENLGEVDKKYRKHRQVALL